MASSNILTRKQLEKMTNEQLIELINDNKQFREKLNLIEAKFNYLKKETLHSKVTVAQKT